MTLFLALRNIRLQSRRYLFIAFAIAIGFALITIVTALAYGTMDTVKSKAARYFSGNISITGYTGRDLGIKDPDSLIRALEAYRGDIQGVSKRVVHSESDTRIFFNGETVRQRRLIGLDVEKEEAEFSRLAFTEGSFKGLEGADGKDGILISIVAAKMLGCRVGDDVMLTMTTNKKQYTSARLFVKGIFNESSIFGYVAYMRRTDLNRILSFPEERSTDIAVYTKAGADSDIVCERLRSGLSHDFSVFPQLKSREARDHEIANGGRIERLAFLPQNAQLAQIKQILDALLAVTYFTLGVFALIVMVGILNTYRVLIYERRSEIGVMRALGMPRFTVGLMFLVEAAVLAAMACTIGFLAGAGVLRLFTIIDFSAIPAAGILLENGRLTFSLDPQGILLNGVVLVLLAVVAVWGPARKAAKTDPAQTIRSI